MRARLSASASFGVGWFAQDFSIDGNFDAVAIVGRQHDLMHDDTRVENVTRLLLQ